MLGKKKSSLEEYHVLNLKTSFMFFKTFKETIIFESFKSFRSHFRKLKAKTGPIIH